jgi:mannose-6-phosphate isomerase
MSGSHTRAAADKRARENAQLRVVKPWGWEIIWAVTPEYTGKFIHILAGKRLSLQYHSEKLETQCLVAGRVTLVRGTADGGGLFETEMKAGHGYTIERGQIHRLIAHEDSDVVEVSTPELGTTVRLEDDYQRPDETEAMRALPQRGWTAGDPP